MKYLKKLKLALAMSAVLTVSISVDGYAAQLNSMNEAVSLARSGQTEKALLIIKPLGEITPVTDKNFWADYLVVLGWAGNQAELVSVFESKLQSDLTLPSYALRSVATVYYNQGKYAQAAPVYAALWQAGDRQFASQYAQTLMRIGQVVQADKVYQAILEKNLLPKYKIYFSKCLQEVYKQDVLAAELSYTEAVTALADQAGSVDILRDFDAEYAAALLSAREYSRAITVLDKYIGTTSASMRMQSNYINAYFLKGNYPEATTLAQKLWADKTKVSVYGLMAWADSYFMLKDYKNAAIIYQEILRREQRPSAMLALAYSKAQLKHDDECISLYKTAYKLSPEMAIAVLGDIEAILGQGNFYLAQDIYKALKNEHPSDIDKISLAQARSLLRNGYTIASQKALGKVTTEQQDQKYNFVKFSGYIQKEMYESAKTPMAQLDSQHPDSIEAYQAKIDYHDARRGGLSASYSTFADYKGNSNKMYNIGGDQYIGNNFYLMLELSNMRLSDSKTYVNIYGQSVGLAYKYNRGQVYTFYSNMNEGGSHSFLRSYIDYSLDDFNTFALSFGKRPVLDAKAVAFSMLSENFATLSYKHKLDQNNELDVQYTRSTTSDDNDFYNYNANFTHRLVNTANNKQELFTYYSRGGFDNYSQYYESPQKRIAYGLGWQSRWILKNSSMFTFRAIGEWGYDNQEPTDFAPKFRLQYTYPLARRQEFVLAAEYGVRTNRLNQVNRLIHGYHLFECSYNISW